MRRRVVLLLFYNDAEAHLLSAPRLESLAHGQFRGRAQPKSAGDEQRGSDNNLGLRSLTIDDWVTAGSLAAKVTLLTQPLPRTYQAYRCRQTWRQLPSRETWETS